MSKSNSTWLLQVAPQNQETESQVSNEIRHSERNSI